MPSTTRGSILISTANDIGEALVEKLGGVGYSPNEWKEKYNLCGIAPVDSAPALSVLADSAGTGDERGSILIATADAIGAILNKKYNVLRGFKPKEWASACRKMKALEEGSVASASIASFSDGADDVPLKSLVVTIPPTLSGVSSLNETQTGRNLFNVADYSQIYTDRDGVDSYNYRYMIIQLKPNTTYTVSQNSGAYSGTPIILINNALPVGGTDYFDLRKASDTKTYTTDSTGQLYIGSVNSYDDVAYTRLQECKVQLEVGSTAHDYEPYNPTTYTANLGRTIYGGTADIVNGVGQENCSFPTLLSSLAWSKTTISGHDAFYANLPDGYMGQGSGGLDGDCDTYAITTDANLGTDKTIRFYYNANFNISRCVIRDDQYASLTGAQFKETVSGNIVYLLAESARTDFTFTGQEINTRLGYNAFWSDSGDTAVEYYQAPTPYARKTATGGIANFSDQRTDLPLTKAIANIAPSIAGKSAVNLYQGSEQYQPTTTYTAELGETVYGGSVDFVSGEVKQVIKKKTVSSFNGTYGAVNNGYAYYIVDADTTHTTSAVDPSNMIANQLFTYGSVARGNAPTWQYGGNDGNNQTHTFILPSDYDTLAKANNFLASLQTPLEVTLTLATPIESAIPGRVISPIEGVNNYWNDAGGDTEIQYFENEA